MAFDPNRYLAEKTASGGFDPHKYLAEKTGQAEPASLGNRVMDTLGNFGKSVNDAYTGGLGAIGESLGIPQGLRSLGIEGTSPQEMEAIRKGQEVHGILNKDSPDWLAGADAFVGGMPGSAQGVLSQEHRERAAKFAKENPWSTMGLGVAGGMASPMPAGEVKGSAYYRPGPVAEALNSASRGLETGAEELAARVPAGTAGQYSAMNTAKRQGMGKLLLDEGAISPTALNLRGVAKRLPELEAKTGAELTDSIKALDQTGGQLNRRDLLNRILTLADEQREMGPGAVNVRNKYLATAKAIADDINESGPMASFASGEKYKQGYQGPINYAKTNQTPLEMGSHEIASAARQWVEDGAEVAASGNSTMDLSQNFLDAKKRSGYAQTANGMANDTGGSIGRLSARGIVGPTARMGGWMAATGALMTGHPGVALASVALPPLAQALKSRSVGAMALTARSASENLARLAAMEPEKLGRFAGILRPALNNGSGNMDEFNARSYALSQTEPDFQALTKHLSEQK